MWAWELWHREKHLGTLVEYDRDFPRVNCHFTPTPEFEAGYRVLFDEEYQLIEGRSKNPGIG